MTTNREIPSRFRNVRQEIIDALTPTPLYNDQLRNKIFECSDGAEFLLALRFDAALADLLRSGIMEQGPGSFSLPTRTALYWLA